MNADAQKNHPVLRERDRHRLHCAAGALRLTRGDGLLIAMVAITALLGALVGRTYYAAGADMVEIRVGNADVTIYPLHEDRIVEARGPRGATTVVIRGAKVFVAASPCRDGLCMKMGPIGEEGGIIACVPNEVTVTVRGRRSETFDAVAR